MGDFGDGFNIRRFAQRVGRRFQKEHFGIGAHRAAPLADVGLRNKADFNAEAGKMSRDEACGCAEQAAAADQMVART